MEQAPGRSSGSIPATESSVAPEAAPAGRTSSLLRSGAIMALGTIASRITGFLRTAVIVAALGTGLLADAYNTANTIPNLVYDLLLGGILTSVVVPMLVRAREQDTATASGSSSGCSRWPFSSSARSRSRRRCSPPS